MNEIFPSIYDELKRMAGDYAGSERDERILQPTAPVHEAYLKLIDRKRVFGQSRAHFFGVAAPVVRRTLADHARRRDAERRSGRLEKLQSDENVDQAVEISGELGALALEKTAAMTGFSPRTATRRRQLARASLYRNFNRT